MQYAIIIEKAKRNFCAFSPDLPGCIATGRTIAEVRKNMREAIEFHLEGMIEDGLPIPRPAAKTELLDVIRPTRRSVNRRNTGTTVRGH